ncbi:hypothetical protein LSH36_2996g00001 [Paralvinella palmiformis]|uniref:Uncharacterized protein n=1 Tax=Paralvinella palmiformis TaxID=53620 RepID=A0AAD9IQ04_9ANNE|nr:hypothetical protein LSH36_2996g00001 [Paralvinella palmiformis]
MVEEFHRKEVVVEGRPLTLDIVDTSGGQEFPTMRDLAIASGDAFLLVFSVVDVDGRLVDRVTTECLVNIDWHHGYIETSARLNVNVDAAFREVLARSKLPPSSVQKEPLRVS